MAYARFTHRFDIHMLPLPDSTMLFSCKNKALRTFAIVLLASPPFEFGYRTDHLSLENHYSFPFSQQAQPSFDSGFEGLMFTSITKYQSASYSQIHKSTSFEHTLTLATSRRPLPLHPRQRLRNPSEQTLHICPHLRTRLHKKRSAPLRLLFPHLTTDLPLIP